MDLIQEFKNKASEAANQLGQQYPFKTKRNGAGMGVYLEFEWGRLVNPVLTELNIEVAQLPDQYNDYTVLYRDGGSDWGDPCRKGELFRVEFKSMDTGAEECKGHFDVPIHRIGRNDLLAVMFWDRYFEGGNVNLKCVDFFIDYARPIARLRDSLHILRGGSFINSSNCPDECVASLCKHHNEAINSKGIRETPNGPNFCRSKNISYSANFGGLVRMTKAKTKVAKLEKKRLLDNCAIAKKYVEFIDKNTTHARSRGA